MDLWETIEKRRTIRKFSAPPKEDQLNRLLEAGAKAPSAGNRQAWFVIIITAPETREKLGEIKKNLNAAFTPDTETGRAMLQMQKDVFKNSTSLMFYTYAPEPNDPHRYDMGSAWLFVENLCLAAVSEGLGTQLFAYWNDAEEEVNQVLGVPENYKQVIGVNVGIPDPAFKPATKVLKSKSKWIFREKWPAD
ncbi:MAG: nitroreductase family protein [Deltaproteobacteria bacterium]|nr:MAG: nitroreductase family protein [Deltaproteobacteria bacterium]